MGEPFGLGGDHSMATIWDWTAVTEISVGASGLSDLVANSTCDQSDSIWPVLMVRMYTRYLQPGVKSRSVHWRATKRKTRVLNDSTTLFVLVFELDTGVIGHFLISLRIVDFLNLDLVPLDWTTGNAQPYRPGNRG